MDSVQRTLSTCATALIQEVHPSTYVMKTITLPPISISYVENSLFFLFRKPGNFAGQHGYGVLSIFAYVDAALQVNAGTPATDLNDGQLATLATTVVLTAASFPFLSSHALVSALFLFFYVSVDTGGRKDKHGQQRAACTGEV